MTKTVYHMDFETRSEADIKRTGAYVYAKHHTTLPLCLCVAKNDGPVYLWTPRRFRRVGANQPRIDRKALRTLALDQDSLVEAHNANFERVIWQHIMVERFGLPPIPLERWRCSAAKAAALNLPRSLEGALEAATGGEVKKDADGRHVMLKMSKPRRPKKWEIHQPDEFGLYWHEDREEFRRLFDYCERDVLGERVLSRKLAPLTQRELKLWQVDQVINDRGVQADIASAQAISEVLKEREQEALKEFQEETGLGSPRQVQKLRDFLEEKHGCRLGDLQKQTLEDALESPDTSPGAKRVIRMRQELAMASTSKIDAMLAAADGKDRRVRGMFLFCGAGTGRWSGRLVQPHNLPRDSYTGDQLYGVLDLFESKDIPGLWELDPLLSKTASRCVRGLFQASAGKEFVGGDFSGVEARGTAWFSEAHKIVKVFETGLDVYKVAAADVYGISYEEVTKDQRQIGKVVVLACGYQGGYKAFQSMGAVYGVYVEESRADAIVKAWREANPEIVRTWLKLEQGAMRAFQTGLTVTVNKVRFFTAQGFRNEKGPDTQRHLFCVLPSGRRLCYPNIRMAKVETPWGQLKDALCYSGADSQTGRLTTVALYGGLLMENIVQALCRDFLREAIFSVEERGWPAVLHVHDEVVSEVPKGTVSVEEYEQVISQVPSWAAGFPLVADGWKGQRYQK